VAHVVVGLGNPGDEYRDTRHNVGQRVLDHVAEEPLGRKPWRRDDGTLVSVGRWRGEDVTLVKPLAFMNVCGPVIGLSADTSCRSTWSRFSVTGSNCMARMIAMRLPESPSNLIVSSWVVRPWPTSMRSTALGSTVTVSFLAPP